MARIIVALRDARGKTPTSTVYVPLEVCYRRHPEEADILLSMGLAPRIALGAPISATALVSGLVHDVAYFIQINVWREQETQVFAKYVGAGGDKTCEVADLQNAGEKQREIQYRVILENRNC